MDTSTPKHIAIICDGNRRWAKSHGWQVIRGHEYAVEHTFEPLIEHARERGVEYLTFWVFSTENWKRDKAEVDGLLDLLRVFFDKNVEQLHKKGVRILVIGDTTKFPQDIQDRVVSAMERTKDNTRLTVTMAMNYGGRDEILRSVKKLAQDVKDGQIQVQDISEELFKDYLDTKNLPDPDYIIRTSGEQRLSGYLPWQGVYSEFYFAPFHFPEFSPEKLDEALEIYASRKRTFGK